MIAYNIQHHGNKFAHLEWLTSTLAGHAAFIDVCLDSPVEQIAAFSTYCAGKHLDNVGVYKSMPVVWAGSSVVNQMRDMLRLALEKQDWEWLVNLSGSCAPIVHPKLLYGIIKAHSKATGKVNFCHSFEPKSPPYWLKSNAQEGLFRHNLARVNVYLDSIAHAEFEMGNLNPVKKSFQRRGVHCSEQLIDKDKAILIRGLHKAELADRIAFYRRTKFLVGRQWIVLHRSAVEWLCVAPKATNVYNLLSQTFCPDESFFQTCLASAPDTIKQATDFHWNFRYRLGSPGKLVPSEILQAKTKNPCALFARKIDPNDHAFRKFIETQLWLS